MRGIAAFMAIVAALVLPGTAHANGYDVVKLSTYTVPTQTYTHQTVLPGTQTTPCCLTNRVARVTLSHYNPLGVRLWSFWEQYNYGTRAGWVWTAQRYCDGTGSIAWNYQGCTKLNHWGHLGYIYVGGKAKADMKSRVSTPWWDLGEHQYPTISMTVYGTGKVTYTRRCGC